MTRSPVWVYDENWKEAAQLAERDDKGNYAYTFRKAGTYYLLAKDPNAGTNDSCYAPATATVTVTGGGAPAFDPDDFYVGEKGTYYLRMTYWHFGRHEHDRQHHP